ncbi:MAG: GNAT family N-acetyltransferase [Gemmatimonas sp.]
MPQPTEHIPSSFQIRRATVADAAIIAHHRCSMFLDMGTIERDAIPGLGAMTVDYLSQAIPAEEYRAWLLYDGSAPHVIVGGAGLLVRSIPPFPVMQGPQKGAVARGKQGLIMNVYVENDWRRRGGADMLMRAVMAHANEIGIESLVLHASAKGRPLYEQLGFVQTNEMRFVPQ